MARHDQILAKLQELLGDETPDGEAPPRKRIEGFGLLRWVARDPLVAALIARAKRERVISCPVVQRLVAETIAAELVDETLKMTELFARKLCHWVLRPFGVRPGRTLGNAFGASRVDLVFDRAIAKAKRLQRQGCTTHADSEFRRAGIDVPDATEGDAIAERLFRARHPTPDILAFDPTRDFLCDALRDKWFVRTRLDTWKGPLPRSSFATELLALGLPRKQHEQYMTQITRYYSEEYACRSADVVLSRRGSTVRNTYERPLLEPEPGLWPNVRAVLLNLLGQDRCHLDFLLDWIAAPLQSIRRHGRPLKLKTAIAFQGAEGAGKGTLHRILEPIYGKSNVALLNQKALDSTFQAELANKLFVVANEVVSSSNLSVKTQNEIKAWVTDDVIHVEAKYRDGGEIANTFNVVFFSNANKPLVIPRDDRRFIVFRTGPILPRAVTSAIYADLEGGQREVAAFLHHLLHRRVQVGVGTLLPTGARVAIQEATAPSEEKFARAIRQQGWLAVSDAWAERQRPRSRDDVEYARVVWQAGGADVVKQSRVSDVYRDFCAREGLVAKSSAALSAAIAQEMPGARQTTRRVGGIPMRVWEGLPMNDTSATIEDCAVTGRCRPAAPDEGGNFSVE